VTRTANKELTCKLQLFAANCNTLKAFPQSLAPSRYLWTQGSQPFDLWKHAGPLPAPLIFWKLWMKLMHSGEILTLLWAHFLLCLLSQFLYKNFTRAGSRFIGAGSDVGGAGSQTGRDPAERKPCGYVRGVYVRQSWNLAFSTPFPVTENDIVHRALILQGVMSWGFCPALPLTGGFWPGGIMSANQTKPASCQFLIIR